MPTFEIKNYLKLLCIRLDHFESYLIDELNTTDIEKIQSFFNLHKNRKGTKILIFEMNSLEMTTFEEIQKYIHTAHIFDYIKQLVTDGHSLLSVDGSNGESVDMFIKCMLESK